MGRVSHPQATDTIQAATSTAAPPAKAPRRAALGAWLQRTEVWVIATTLAVAAIAQFRAAYLIDTDESQFYYRAGLLTVFAGVIICWVLWLAHALRQARQEAASERARNDALEARVKDLEERMGCRELARQMLEGDRQAAKKLAALLQTRENWGN